MTLATDSQGFLLDARSWTETWAKDTAINHSLSWEAIDVKIVEALRAFYFEFELSPPMRPLVKHLKNTLGADIGNSMWLMHRYGESPARTLALLAGLPKPKNCL